MWLVSSNCIAHIYYYVRCLFDFLGANNDLSSVINYNYYVMLTLTNYVVFGYMVQHYLYETKIIII